MSLELYEFCALLFLLHGVGTPVLFVVTGLALRGQWRERDDLETATSSSLTQRGRARGVGSRLESLPKLEPLACPHCGAPFALEATQSTCRHCAKPVPIPDDYLAARALQPLAARLVARADRAWRGANALTHPVTRVALVVMLVAQPMLFVVTLKGSSDFRDTWLDRAFERIGETGAAAAMGMAILGFVIWMITYGMLASLARELRRKLPIVPVLRAAPRTSELARCETCGGGVAYESSAFAALCGYCHGVSYRARFVRRERVSIEASAHEARDALFGAMDIVSDFTSTLFFTLTFLGVVPMVVLGLGAAFGSD